MRIVVIGDTHGFTTAVPNGDLLIHCGDFTRNHFERHEINLARLMDFNDWLGHRPHQHKIVIAGNHDRVLETHPEEAEPLLTNAIYLKDSGVEIEGIKFWGSPWQPEFMNWAFNLPRDGMELKEKYDLIPADTKVLITHGPPHWILDGCPAIENRRYVPGKTFHAGCKQLLTAVKRVKPDVHLFGHIHDGYGQLIDGGVRHINASICTGDYRPVNLPVVIDI